MYDRMLTQDRKGFGFVGKNFFNFCLALSCLFFGFTLSAQKESYNWQFGYGAGVSFTGNPPVPAGSSSNLSASEGCASMSDKDGNLLFYTDGRIVYDKTGTAMPNGTGLLGSNISAQSSIIIPFPGSQSKYYIFTVSNWTDWSTNLAYCIVDMNRGAHGDITTKNIILNTNVSEQVSATWDCNKQDIWVVTHEMDNATFVSYKVTSTGINTPVTSVIGSSHSGSNRYGGLRFSHAGNRLVSALGGSSTESCLEMFDFDKSTGIVSNYIPLVNAGTYINMYSSEFSPDDSKLYFTQVFKTNLYQVDFNNGGLITMISAGSAAKGSLQLGPDNKVYVGMQSSRLGVIASPDAPGIACKYSDNAVSFSGSCNLGLPNFLSSPTPRTVRDTSACANSIVLYGRPGFTSYHWSTGALTNNITPTVSGTYWVDETQGGCTLRDTIIVTLKSGLVVHLGRDTSLCKKSRLMLDAGSGWSSVLWSTSASSQTIAATTTGTYWVEVSNGTCKGRDSLVVTFLPLPVANAGNDKTVCKGDTVLIGIGGSSSNVYAWSPAAGLNNVNSANPKAFPTVTTTYILTVTGQGSATNLVQNGSFENGLPPNSFSQLDKADYWSNPTNPITSNGSPDYFRSDASDARLGSPVNFAGTRTPHSGNAYMGLITYSKWNLNREYAQNQLSETLSAGTTYLVEFYVAAAGGVTGAGTIKPGKVTNKIGAAFLSYKLDTSCSYKNLPYTPVYQHPALITDSVNWTKVSFTYTAKGNEKYLLIGNFSDDAGTSVQTPADKTAATAAYYYFDDVSVIPVINSCENLDTVVVTVKNKPDLNLGRDTMICPGQSVTLDAGSGFTSYLWSNHATTQVVSLNGTGLYWAEVTGSNGCSARDTMELSLHSTAVFLGNDTNFCEGTPFTLNAGATWQTVKWSTGATSPVLALSTSGTYAVSVTDAYCSYKDTIKVAFDPLPLADAGTDKSICPGDSVSIGIPEDPQNIYSWTPATGLSNPNSSNPKASPGTSTTYVLHVTPKPPPDIVQNGGFEEGQQPTFISQLDYAKYWTPPSKGTPDYFRSDATYPGTSVPDNMTGHRPAYEGNAYAGFYTLTLSLPTYREYLQNELAATLQAGETYRITLYVSLIHALNGGDIGGASNNLAVAFSNRKIDTNVYSPLGFLNPAYESQNIISDSTHWTKVSFRYTAKGDEKYMIIGNFKSDANTTFIPGTTNLMTDGRFAYYCVDGVSAVKVKATCTKTDTVIISVKQKPLLNLGRDTTLCKGNLLNLDAGTSALTYKWSTGETSQKITVSGDALVSVSVSNADCSSKDTIKVVFQPRPVDLLANDTVVCAGAAITLKLNNTFNSYFWSTGAVTSAITVNAEGTYWVDVDDGVCISRDSILVKNSDQLNLLVPDTALCEGNTLLLDAGFGFNSYRWSTGATSQTLTVTGTSLIYLSVTNGSCIAKDSIKVTFQPLPVIHLGNDTSLCKNFAFLLDAGAGFVNYKWSDGNNTRLLTAIDTGMYWAEVSNGFCKARDTLVIRLLKPEVNLGNDSTLCGGALTLDAGAGWQTYQWSNGAATRKITVQATGSYCVSVSNNTCQARDTIQLNFLSALSVKLGRDTVLTLGDSILLDAGNGFTSYAWSTSATTQKIQVKSSGLYSVTVSNDWCQASDTIKLVFLPVKNLGEDITLCENALLVLDAGNPGAIYKWSTGASSQTIQPSQSGIFWVSVTVNGASIVDSIKVTFIPFPTVSLGPDTTLCVGSTLQLDAGSSGNNYKWSTGATSASIKVNTSDEYKVTVSNFICITEDSIRVTFENPPIVNLGSDTILCAGTKLTLNAYNNNAKYNWSTGATTSSILISKKGQYWGRAQVGACESKDTITINFYLPPQVNAGQDTIIVKGSTVALHGTGAVTYNWNPYTMLSCSTCQEPLCTPEQTTVFTLTGTDEHACSASDSVTVMVDASQAVFVPNAFSPNEDGQNDILYVRGVGLESISFYLYNRWGEKVFESHDLSKGWDGTYNGNKLNTAVFMYYLEAVFINGKHVSQKGDVSLIR